MSVRDGAVRGTSLMAALLGILIFATGCDPSSSSARPQSPQETSFAEVAILPSLEFADAPQVILANASDFRDLCIEAKADRVLGRMDADTGVWLEFALVIDGVFYVLPANGYHTPYDRFDGERLEMPSARFYYELERRDRQEYKFRSYFIE